MLATDWKNNKAITDKRTAEIFGLEDSHPWEDFVKRIHPDDRVKRQQSIDEALDTGSFDFEVRLLFDDGRIRWMRSKGMVQKNMEGQATGTFGIVQDITSQKEFSMALHNKVEERTAQLEIAYNSLVQVNEQLARSNKNLEEFARAASHDLKEPIRKINFFSDRLKNLLHGRLSVEEKDFFNRVLHAAGRMSLLVDDLLQYSHLDHSPVEKEKVDLNKKIQLILSDIELAVQEKNAIIEVGKLPVVKGYRRQLQQLFQNLISNALKYSKHGTSAHIKITSKEIPGKQAMIELPGDAQERYFYLIEVCDNGIGFNQEDADRIFNVFTRLHGNSEYPGTGIGLSIAKKVVDNHGGFIYAKGEEGGGACFSVLLPVSESIS